VPGLKWPNFDTLKAKVTEDWKKVPKQADPQSPQLKDKITEWIKNFDANFEKLNK